MLKIIVLESKNVKPMGQESLVILMWGDTPAT